MKLSKILGNIAGSPCNTARFLENSLKFPGRFKLNRGTNDINCIQPKRSQVASIVPPKTTEINTLDPNVNNSVIKLALDWAWAAAFCSSEMTERKNGISFETSLVLKAFPSESVKSSGELKVKIIVSKSKN